MNIVQKYNIIYQILTENIILLIKNIILYYNIKRTKQQ